MTTDTFELSGKMFGVSEPGPPIAEADVAALELAIGFRLPDQLRSYHKRWNGAFCFPIEVPPQSSIGVRLFWRAGAEAVRSGCIGCLHDMLQINSEVNDLLETWMIFKDRFPPDLLCFQRDPCGNLYLIGTGKANLGRIYFWARDYQADEEESEMPSYDNIADVAPSFVDFLLALRDSHQPEGESDEDWIRRNYPQ